MKEGNRRTQKAHPDLLRKDEMQCELSKWRISSHALDSRNEDVELHTGPHGVVLQVSSRTSAEVRVRMFCLHCLTQWAPRLLIAYRTTESHKYEDADCRLLSTIVEEIRVIMVLSKQ